MADIPIPPEDKQTEPYTPAPVPKRIIAWTGIIYMVIIVFLTTLPFFRGGQYLRGVGPLLVCPGTAGLFAICLWQVRQPDCPPAKRMGMVALAVVCVAIFVLGLVDGIPPLIAQLGGGQ